MMGMGRFLMRLPKLAGMAIGGAVDIQVRRLEPGHYGVVVRSRYNSPDFTAGAVEAASWQGDVKMRVEVVRRSAEEFELLVAEVGSS
jgi:hypothetical protein